MASTRGWGGGVSSLGGGVSFFADLNIIWKLGYTNLIIAIPPALLAVGVYSQDLTRVFPQSGCFTRAVTRAAAALHVGSKKKKYPLKNVNTGTFTRGEKKNPHLCTILCFFPAYQRRHAVLGMRVRIFFTPARDGTLDIYM